MILSSAFVNDFATSASRWLIPPACSAETGGNPDADRRGGRAAWRGRRPRRRRGRRRTGANRRSRSRTNGLRRHAALQLAPEIRLDVIRPHLQRAVPGTQYLVFIRQRNRLLHPVECDRSVERPQRAHDGAFERRLVGLRVALNAFAPTAPPAAGSGRTPAA